MQENLVGIYIIQYVTNSNDGLRFYILMKNAFISINCNFYSKVTLQPLIKKRGWGPVILTPTMPMGLVKWGEGGRLNFFKFQNLLDYLYIYRAAHMILDYLQALMPKINT